MIPQSFSYYAPESLEGAIDFLNKHSDAKVLAGGMSLIPVMKFRLAAPAYIVDINRIPGLESIKVDGDTLRIGALVRHHDLEKNELVKKTASILSETASLIGDPQIRNRGSIGGSLVECDPSGDWGAAILALRGKMVIDGSHGKRTVKSDDFFVDTFTSAVAQGEILTEIRIPVPPKNSFGTYTKFERRVGDFATAAVALQLSIDEKGVCEYAGLGLTAVGPTNLRARSAEEVLLGKPLTKARIDEAAEAASQDARPAADPLRGSVEYKKEMIKIFTKRALEKAYIQTRRGA